MHLDADCETSIARVTLQGELAVRKHFELLAIYPILLLFISLISFFFIMFQSAGISASPAILSLLSTLLHELGCDTCLAKWLLGNLKVFKCVI